MTQLRLFAALVVIALPTALAAQQGKPARKPARAAQAFTLDLPNVPETDAVTSLAADVPAAKTPATSRAAASAATALFTLDTPIERLLADLRAKAVLDKDVPGLSDDENLPRFRTLSLRRFQPLTGGQMTDALLARVEADLATIGPMSKGKGRNASR